MDGQSWLLVPASGELLDILAAFEAEGEDRVVDLEDEPDEGKEDARDSDNAFDYGGGISGIYASDDEPE